MTRLPPAVAVWAGLLGGCGVDEGGGPLEWPTEARAALLGVRPEGSETVTRTWLSGLELEGAEVSLPRGGDAWLLGFAPTLEALQVSPGPVRGPAAGPEDCGNLSLRKLPFATHRVLGGPNGWRTVDAFESGVFEEVRLPPLELNLCLERGGCIEASRSFCQTACSSAPSITPPREPLAVRSPTVCPSCTGGRPIPAACSQGRRFDVTTGGCRRLGAVCPGGRFPEPSPSDPPTVYVDGAAAPGGDGSLSRPFRMLEAALGSSARVLLAPGRYSVDGLELADAWIEGVCPETSHLLGTLRLSGTSTLGNLRLEGSLEVETGAFVTATSMELVLPSEASELVLVVRGRFEGRSLALEGGVEISASGRASVIAAALRGSPAFTVLGSAEVAETYFERAQPSAYVVRTLAGGTLTLRGSMVSATGANGVRVSGGRLSLEDVLIEGEVGNVGLFAQRAAELELSRVRVSGFASFPVLVEGEAQIRGGTSISIRARAPMPAS